MIRVDDHSKLKESEGFGIAGTLVDFTLVKSRTNRAGSVATLVFDQENGYDEELSLFFLLKEAGKINGAGVGLYLGDRNDVKFSQKSFKDKIAKHDDIKQLFMEEVIVVLKGILESQGSNNSETETRSDLELTDTILNMINEEAA